MSRDIEAAARAMKEQFANFAENLKRQLRTHASLLK